MDIGELEAIRALKHRYLRAVDLKRWDELASCLHEQAVAGYGTRTLGEPLELTGRAAILEFMREKLDNGIITMHMCGQHEITLDGNTARASWAMRDTVIVPEHGVLIEGAAYYNDQYEHTPEHGWTIRRTEYERIYESLRNLNEESGFQLLANRWDDQQK